MTAISRCTQAKIVPTGRAPNPSSPVAKQPSWSAVDSTPHVMQVKMSCA